MLENAQGTSESIALNVHSEQLIDPNITNREYAFSHYFLTIILQIADCLSPKRQRQSREDNLMTDHTRREFAQLAGTAVVGTTGLPQLISATGKTSNTENPETVWSEVSSPTSKTLYGVVDTVSGPLAVGAGGDIVARRQNDWKKVVEYGPQARSRLLTGVDVTDDGKAIWFVGGSGVIGEYNVVTETLTNYSAPNGKTSTWEGCAVKGDAGKNERLYFVNGSGELLVGTRQKSGALQYDKVIKPGGGSTMPSIDFYNMKKGHVCSTSQFVATTTDGGDKWKKWVLILQEGGFSTSQVQDQKT